MKNDSVLDIEIGLLTPLQSAIYLSISKPTLYRLVSQRKIKFYKIGGSLKFKRKDLEQYIEGCSVEAMTTRENCRHRQIHPPYGNKACKLH